MMAKSLTPPADTVEAVAGLFEPNSTCSVSIREDRAFGPSEFLCLGSIRLFPEDDGLEHRARAVRRGAFEWRAPDFTAVNEGIRKVLGINDLNGAAKIRGEDKVRRILDMFGALPVRLGLGHPIFDPHALAEMPFRRPVTVVSDTSGVLQGGLGFISRYLYPAGRIKVPAVTHMEIVNFTDRFLKNRRASNVKRPDLMMDHLKSQAGQRVLVQLELRSDVELERTFLLGDPLRGSFQRDQDKELSELNLSIPIKSYADRLILEAARQHQSQMGSNHRVMLLTGDQGLARMAMAEGISPIYFRAARADAFFGKRFTGANFHPFSGELHTTSIPEILWELATISGCARLSAEHPERNLTVHAIGEELAWAPYHSRDDLLWVEFSDGPATPRGLVAQGAEAKPSREAESHAVAETPAGRRVRPPARRRPLAEGGVAKAALYKVNLDRLFALIDKLETRQQLPLTDVMTSLGVRTESGLDDYRRFLESGEAIIVEERSWSAAPPLSRMAVVLRNPDVDELRKELRLFPSYVELERVLSQEAVGVAFDATTFGRAAYTYTALAELAEIGASVHGAGFFVTPRDPGDDGFAKIAVSAYDRLELGGSWVATGRWLEELIVEHGIHPVVARRRLQSAASRGLVKRVTEGSTTETGHDRHTLRTLALKDGAPYVKVEYLYRGDFLIPGKASSSLKIELIET